MRGNRIDDRTLVSIIIPTCNRPALAARALQSARTQSHGALDILIVDDGDRPDTGLAQAAAGDGRVRLLRNSRRLGAAASRNRALGAARGEFCTFMDDDDCYAHGRIAMLLAAWDEGLGLICDNHWVVTSGPARRCFVGGARLGAAALRWGDNYIGNAPFTRTGRLRALGGYDEGLDALQDLDLCLRLAMRHGPALRLARAARYQHLEHGLTRISSSPARARGLAQFASRHSAQLSPAQARYLQFLRALAERRTLRALGALWHPALWWRLALRLALVRGSLARMLWA